MSTKVEDELADRIFDIIGKHEHDSGTDTWAASKELAAFVRQEIAPIMDMAQKHVDHLKQVFEESDDDGGCYHDWKDAEKELKGTSRLYR